MIIDRNNDNDNNQIIAISDSFWNFIFRFVL